MRRKKQWPRKQCCDWDTFLDSLMASARRLNFPVLLINRCEARRYWRQYGCTGHEVVVMQRAREMQDALYSGYGEPPISRGDDGGGGKDPDAPLQPNFPRPLQIA